jgi:2-polyprenyl-3-methyl-5-hydroxy-6-metoxy-1,4-benzoquinol methylase
MVDPEGIALAHARLSATQLAQGAYGPALESMAAALKLAPGVGALWAQFSELVRFFSFRHPADPLLRELLGRALEHPAVDPGNLVRPISTIALSRTAGEVLQDPLLLRLMEDAVLRDLELEDLLVSARRAALKRMADDKALVAIAHQAFNTEYVWDESAEERDGLEKLRQAMLAASSVPPHWYAIYACYRPLHTLPQAERIASKLARRQVQEPLEELRLRATIPALSGALGGVSAAVQAQYESNPYPRWLRTQSSLVRGSLPEILHELFPNANVKVEGLTDANPKILVAGCGTGQNSIVTAQRFRDAQVLAVDLSLASLAYAKRKTLELGVKGIEYRQADILALGEVPQQRFDLVECSGVLHHLEDPFAGWRILASLLRPLGLMRIGLYSRTARRHIAQARGMIAAAGFAADPDGIRRCRAAIRARKDEESFAKIVRGEDFFSISGCRDLLFHVQEHSFSLPDIAAMLERLDLRFLGFEFPDGAATQARYRARFPRDRDLSDLQSWDRFEQDHPDTFGRMYQFWACRRD